MALKEARIWKWWGKVFILALLVILLIRAFVFQSYTVSSNQMELSIKKGDRLIVNKLAYGVRLPSTILSIPFTFDSFWGHKSYVESVQLGYHRLFSDLVSPNDVVLMNNPVEKYKPFDKRSLLISRCVALPGDTLRISNGNFYINGREYIDSPDLMQTYSFEIEAKDSIKKLMNTLGIEKRNLHRDSLFVYCTLSKYESALLNERLGDTCKIKLQMKDISNYCFLVPAKGSTVLLSDQNKKMYEDIIMDELAINSIDMDTITTHTFKNNYYWFLSDNQKEAVDSRSLGFISEKYLIGKVSYIW